MNKLEEIMDKYQVDKLVGSLLLITEQLEGIAADTEQLVNLQ